MKSVNFKPFAQSALFGQLDKYLRENHDIHNWSHDDIERHDHKTIFKPLEIVFLHATPQQEEAYKEAERAREEAEEIRLSHQHDQTPRPIIDYHNPERWREGLNQAKNGHIVELCADAYDHFLGCVPPKRFEGIAYICGEADHHNNEGQAVYLCATKKDGKYIAQYGTVQQFEAHELFKGEAFKYQAV